MRTPTFLPILHHTSVATTMLPVNMQLLASKPYVAASKDTSASGRGISNTVTLYGGRSARLKLNILIVGSGLGGLAAAFTLSKAGHHITILESAQALADVGAGIQVAPNISRQLIRWGLGPALEHSAVRPEAIVFRRYNTGEMVGYTQLHSMEDDYDAPYYHIHRAEFQRLLLGLVADTHNVVLRLNATVRHIDPSERRPSVTLATGEVVRGDLIIGADGIKSLIREVVVGRPDSAMPTGDAIYRAVIPASHLVADPDLRPLIETPQMTSWMGPKLHIMAYCIRGGQAFNMGLVHPDDGSVESWNAEGSADKMRMEFADFEPKVQKLLAMVPSTLKWKLMDRAPLESWVHPSGRVALLGDACHPMLPYRAQGAAMAIEDAAVLGHIFSHLAHPAQIAPMLRAYQDLRLPRTADTQLSSRLNQEIFHLPDGPAQEERDANMREAMRLADQCGCEGNQNQWADRTKNDKQFGYDADREAERWWRETGEREIGSLRMGPGVWMAPASRL